MADVVKSVSVRLTTTGYEDAKLKIDKLAVSADELSKKHPEITPEINSAKALLEARLLRDGIRKELSKGVMAGTDLGAGAAQAFTAAGLPGFLTPMTALIAAGVALSPILVTVGTGLAGVGAAAYSAVGPVLKAAQATGGLRANMASLTVPQQEVARGLLSLKGSFDKFAFSLQPQVFSAFNSGLGIARTLLKDVEPVAAAAGSALDKVLTEVGQGLQDQEWRQFFTFMAQNAGPDVLLVAKAVGSLADALPPLLEDLQPVGRELLSLVTETGQLTGGIATLIQQVNSLGTHSTATGQSQGLLSKAFHSATQNLIPEAGLAGVLKDRLDKMGDSSKKAASATTTAGSAAGKAGTSIKVMGNSAQTAAAQATTLYNAMHKLLDPLTANINDAVTFKNDQVTLAAALKASSDQVGLHTAKQRASATAMSQAAQDALTLSQNIYTQTGSARKALGPLQSLAGELNRTGAQGAYAKQILAELKRAEDLLYSKEIDIHVNTRFTQIGAPGMGLPYGTVGTGGPPAPVKRRHASGGWASGWSLVGEQGPELMYTPGSQVYPAGQTQQMLGGGDTYHVTVNVPPTVNPKEAGRQVAELILAHTKNGGRLYPRGVTPR